MAAPHPSAAAAPLAFEEFEAAWRGLGAPARILLAVSGGVDSMALAALGAELQSKRLATVFAASVDHGLREGAGEEAARVAGWLSGLGVDCRVLRWKGEKPSAGIQAAARRARYRLLCEAAAQGGADAIMTAHTADDQVETVLMRMARGGGAAALAGMRTSRPIAAGAGDPVLLLRPLLSVRRARLSALLRARSLPSVADPSNENPVYERVRMRRLKGLLDSEAPGFSDGVLSGAAAMRRTADTEAAARLSAFRRAGGFFTRSGAASFVSAEEVSLFGAALARAVSGADYALSDEIFAAHSAAIAALGEGRRLSLGGVLFERTGGDWRVYREPAALLGRAGVSPAAAVEAPPGARILWDNRFIVGNDSSVAVSVAPAGSLTDEDLLRIRLEIACSLEDARSTPAILAPEGGVCSAVAPPPGVFLRALAEERFTIGVQRF